MGYLHIFRALLLIIFMCTNPAIYASANNDDTAHHILQKIDRLLDADSLVEIVNQFNNILDIDQTESWSCVQKGRILHKIGVAHYLLDQEYEAIKYFRKVVDSVWINCFDISVQEKANTEFNIGLCYQYTPEKGLARQYLVNSIQSLESDSNTTTIDLAQKYHSAGVYFGEIRDLSQARRYLSSALTLYEGISGTEGDQYDLLNDLLVLSLDFNQFNSAIDHYQRARSILKSSSVQISDRDQAIIHLNAASAYLELDKFELSQNLIQVAQYLLSKDEDPDLYANALETLAMLRKRQGLLPEAIDLVNEVIAIRDDSTSDFRHHYTTLAIAYENKSEVMHLAGQYQNALFSVNKSIRLLCPGCQLNDYGNPIIKQQYIMDPIPLSRILAIKGKIQRQIWAQNKTGRWLVEASATYAIIDTIISKSIYHFSTDLSQLEFANLITTYLGDAMDFHLQLYEYNGEYRHLEKAFWYIDRAKALVLESHLAKDQAASQILSLDLIHREQTLLRALSIAQDRYLSNTSDDLSLELIKKQTDIQVFYDSLASAFPEYHRWKPDDIELTINQIHSKLERGQCLVELYEYKDHIIAFWLSRDHFFYTKTALDIDLQTAIQVVQSGQSNPDRAYDKIQSNIIYKKIFYPGLEKLSQITRLLIIPSPSLFPISIEALTIHDSENQSQFMISKYSISYAFSTSLAAHAQSNNRLEKFVGFGTNYSGQLNQNLHTVDFLRNVELSNFHNAEKEVMTIGEAVSGTTFTQSESSLKNFITSAPSADVLYLSLHGLVDYDDPQRSCILFDDRTQPFVLSPHLLQSIDLNTSLIILSSCHSASGKAYYGEGASGMTRAFLYAGAQHVVASLWSATEGTATKILSRFVFDLRKERLLDQAIQNTKLNFLAGAPPHLHHPYYWSNFILLGSLDQNIAKKHNYALYFAMLGAFLLFWWLKNNF